MKSKFRLRIFVLCAVFAALLCFAPGKVWAGEFFGLGYTAPADYEVEQDYSNEPQAAIVWEFSDGKSLAINRVDYDRDPGESPTGVYTKITGRYSGLGDLPVWESIVTEGEITLRTYVIDSKESEFTVVSFRSEEETETFMNSLQKNNLTAPGGGGGSGGGGSGCNAGLGPLALALIFPAIGITRRKK